ncbi:MAG: xanthine dehydrogenase family protein molybdopterin-binding subunit, partial [Acidobacteriota bacterium]
YGRRGDFLTAASIASLCYQPLAMRFRGVSVFTNTPPRGAQRAPGGAQLNTILEPLLDKAARRLDIDRVAIRRINAPDRNAKYGSEQRTVTSAYVREAFDKGAKLFGWEEKKKLSGRRQGSKVTGVGVGLGAYSAGSTGYDGLITIKPDGKLYIQTGCSNLGTGSFCDTARAAAEVLGMPWEQCEILWGDTRKHLPWSCVQGGSQTIHAHTRANFAAAMDAKRKLQEIASMDLGGSGDDYEVGNGRVYLKANPSRRLSFAQAARRAIELGGKFSGYELSEELNPMTVRSAEALAGQGLMGVAKDTRPREGRTVAFVVGFAQVELDVETGQVDIVEFTAVADCGTVVNPRGLAGQMHGGAVQGFGIARSQKWLFDPQWGVPSAKRLHAAKPPTILDVPLEMKGDAVNLPDPYNPLGAKGIGEPPVGAGAAAVLGAIADALGEERYFNRTPVTADMILNILEAWPQPYKPLTVHV